MVEPRRSLPAMTFSQSSCGTRSRVIASDLEGARQSRRIATRLPAPRRALRLVLRSFSEGGKPPIDNQLEVELWRRMENERQDLSWKALPQH